MRIQGTKGRYTRVLSDGLPHSGDVGGLALLQIPPMDLEQVEVIKGVASACTGRAQCGGVINLLSRRQTSEPESEFLLNRSTRALLMRSPISLVRSSVAGAHRCSAGGRWQTTTDVNDMRGPTCRVMPVGSFARASSGTATLDRAFLRLLG